jgi:hypothetical protein
MTTREEWLTRAVTELRPLFHAVSFPLPANIRVTCGFPSRHARARNRFVGEHWSGKASEDGTHEILISPVEDDPIEVFAVLVHELAHAATDGDGHGSLFKRCVRSLWLEGKPTATRPGAKFKDEYTPLIESLGAYPHARLNVGVNVTKQSTRLLKASCPTCGYTIRLSDKWVKQGLPVCPVDGSLFVV